MAGSPLYGLAPDRRALMRDRLAQQMLAQGVDTSPIQSPWQGVARLAQALMGGQMMRRGEEETAKRETDYASGLNAALMGEGGAGDIATRLGASGNKDLMQLATQFRIKDIDGRQVAERDKAKRDADRAQKEWEYKTDPSKLAAGRPTGIVAEYEYAKQQGFPGDLFSYQKQKAEAGRTPAQPTAPPAAIAEYNFAKQQGFPGSFMEFQTARSRPPAGSQEERDDAILFDPNADVTSPEYRAAHFRRSQDRLKNVTDEQGNVRLAAVPTELPSTIRPPGGPVEPLHQLGGPPPYEPSGSTPAPQVLPQDPGLPPAQAQAAPAGQPPGIRFLEPPKNKDLTESQAKANMFGTLMEKAHKEIEPLSTPGGASIVAWRNLPEPAVNAFMSSNNQQYFNALRTFAAGILRKETGASFGRGELEDVQTRFFPMPGNDAATIAQKAASRKQAIESMRAEIPGGKFRGVVPPAEKGKGDVPPPPPGFIVMAP